MAARGDRGRGPRGRGRLTPGMRPVDETTRIDIASILASFQASDATEYTFPPGLSNHDRAVVHSECKRYGFKSKSFGKGAERAVTVFKPRPMHHEDPIYELPLGDHSRSHLNTYFAAFPPTGAELAAASAGDENAALGMNTAVLSTDAGIRLSGKSGAGKKRTGGNYAAEFDSVEVDGRRQRWEAAIASSGMEGIIAARSALPIAAHREEIISAMETHQVVLIAGETGCGKTTQVPQFIVEDFWHRGRGCRVICTQPRRISAVSVAERVAAERGESIGENVGYTIRLDSKGGSNASLMFCTNGILLRMLTDSTHDALSHVTHLVIDEIHERDRFADFLLILIRDCLPRHPHLRVVLMSATLHVELFSSYFGQCPVVRVPGFTHPVQDFYLEDVLKLTGYEAAAVEEIQASLGERPAALVGLSNKNKIGRKSTSRMDLEGSPSLTEEERRRIEDAIELAFRTGSDDAFDALTEITGAAGAEDIGVGAPGVNVRHSSTGATALIAAAFHGRADVAAVLLSNGADPSLVANNGMTPREWAAQYQRTDVLELLEDWEQQATAAEELASSALALSHYQSNTDADEVDLGLVEALLSYVCGVGKFAVSTADKKTRDNGSSTEEGAVPLGAVLVFLPGWDEIIRLKENLEKSRAFGSGHRHVILPLHSMVAPAEQRRVFVRPPAGTRKIVLSTNIAETAVTIDDVVCVIDTGRLKEKSYDPFTGVSTLQGAWISKASERQRRGRAGRCQPGVAFHMYSRQRSESFIEYQLPELKRSPLDEMGLQVKLLERPGEAVSIAGFLAKAVEPPIPQAVDAAVALLEDIGALDQSERLTQLGRHLAALPLPPALGKMLLYGVLYNSLDPILTIACSMAYRDPWILPAQAEARRQAALLRARLSTEAGGSSDHLATVRAYNGWKAALSYKGDRAYCSQHFLSPATMNMIDGMRSQLLGELISRGFVTTLEHASVNARNADLVRAVLACGFYPLIGRLVPSPPRDQKARAQILTRKSERVRIHPASVNSKLRIERPEEADEAVPQYVALLFFDELTRGDSMLYIKSSTAMHPHPVVLVAAHVVPESDTTEKGGEEDMECGGALTTGVGNMQLGDKEAAVGESRRFDKLSAIPETALLVVDGWLRFRVPFTAVAQLSSLRVRIAAAFASKVCRPQDPLPPVLQGAIDASVAIFINESESGDGTETYLETSYEVTNNHQATRMGYGGRRGGRGHLFRYDHHGPPTHRTGAGGRSQTAFRGRGGRSGGSEDLSFPYQGPYAPPNSYVQEPQGFRDATSSRDAPFHGGHGVKRTHSELGSSRPGNEAFNSGGHPKHGGRDRGGRSNPQKHTYRGGRHRGRGGRGHG